MPQRATMPRMTGGAVYTGAADFHHRVVVVDRARCGGAS